jgi:hypothetical protein
MTSRPGMTGRTYLESGHPVAVLKRWASVPAVAVSAVIWLYPPKRNAPRNVLVRRDDGSLTCRPFRGLRKIKGEGNGDH